MGLMPSPSVWNSTSGGDATIPTRVTALENTYVYTDRFASISSGTSGTVALPPNAVVVLGDFGGIKDAVLSTLSGSGRPTSITPLTGAGAPISTTFDSSGNYTISATPASYPISIIYRVRQKLIDFDSTASNIIGGPDFVGVPGGATTQVQYNDAGTFAGDATFTFDKTNKLLQPQSILAVGTFGSGWTEPNLGAGTRMMWYPRKAAIRAGNVSGTQWNNANIGDYSVAFGLNNKALSSSSFSVGQGNTAGGTYSATLGFNNSTMSPNTAAFGTSNSINNTAAGSFAAGDSNIITALNCAAFGDNNEIDGSASFSAGEFNTVTGSGSAAFGFNCIVSGSNALAVGDSCNANSASSASIGNSNDVTGVGAFSAGSYNITNGNGAVAIGYGNTAQNQGAVTIGQNNTNTGNAGSVVGAYNSNTGALNFTAGYSNTNTHTAGICLGLANTMSNSSGGFMAGYYLSNNSHAGVGMLGDNQTTATTATADNQFSARYLNGFRFLITGPNTTDIAFSSTGSVSIGSSSPDASAKLDVISTTKGFLLPRMSNTQINAISSPTAGLMAYGTDYGTHKGYDGTSWNTLLKENVVVSNSTKLDLSPKTTGYVFYGVTSDWTLPAISEGVAHPFFIKNRGTGAITVKSSPGGGGTDIYDAAAVATLTVLPGRFCVLLNDGTYWVVM